MRVLRPELERGHVVVVTAFLRNLPTMASGEEGATIGDRRIESGVYYEDTEQIETRKKDKPGSTKENGKCVMFY